MRFVKYLLIEISIKNWFIAYKIQNNKLGAVLVMDNDGKRLIARYYTDDFPSVKEQKVFSKFCSEICFYFQQKRVRGKSPGWRH